MNRALHWLRARTGVRVVSALAAAAAVAVVLVVAGVSLVLLLDHQLRQSNESAAQSQADVLGQRIAANFVDGDVKANSINATGKRGDIVQVVIDYGDGSESPDSTVGSNGPQTDVQVIGSSDTLDSRPRMVQWLLAPGETRVVPSAEILLADGSTEEVTIVGKGYRAIGAPITVLAAQPLKPVHQAVDTVAVMVSIGIPILVLVTGFFTYLFAGRALRPVEAMRRRVAGLTDRDLDRRVPEPPAQDEVGRLARTMNQMLSRLQDSQATQRRFVADASHELRSPLATVSTGLELLGNGMGKDSADLATVQTLRGETGRLTKLVEGLLFLARADERGLAPRREEVDLDEIVESERVRPSADHRVSVTVSTEPVRVVGDRSQLVRVLRNLVDNARRHAATTVSVSVRADGDLAVIDVDDDGSGVPEADRTRVFERFVRLDEARARGDGGSGLGLAIVAELVSAHGGAVTAGESETLGGARFRVTVPLSGTPGSLDVGEQPATTVEAGEPGDGQDAPEPAGPDRPVQIPGQAGRGRRAPATAPTAGPAEPVVSGSDLFTPSVATAAAGPATDSPTTGADTRASATPAVDGASAPSPGEGVTSEPAPVLFDDRPSGPLPRVPMGGRRRRPGEETPPGNGTAPDPSEPVPAGAPVGSGATEAPVNGTGPAPWTSQPIRTPEPRSPVSDPPTGPLPIRPNTVGSPADENATRPLPQIRPAGTGRAGTVVAPARRHTGTNGTARTGTGHNGAGHNGQGSNGSGSNGSGRNGANGAARPNGHGSPRPGGQSPDHRNGHRRNGSAGRRPPERDTPPDA